MNRTAPKQQQQQQQQSNLPTLAATPCGWLDLMFGGAVTRFLRAEHNPVPATLQEALPSFRAKLCRKIYVITPSSTLLNFQELNLHNSWQNLTGICKSWQYEVWIYSKLRKESINFSSYLRENTSYTIKSSWLMFSGIYNVFVVRIIPKEVIKYLGKYRLFNIYAVNTVRNSQCFVSATEV